MENNVEFEEKQISSETEKDLVSLLCFVYNHVDWVAASPSRSRIDTFRDRLEVAANESTLRLLIERLHKTLCLKNIDDTTLNLPLILKRLEANQADVLEVLRREPTYYAILVAQEVKA